MPYGYVLSGATATFGPQIAPIACYHKQAGKTFFVYAGPAGDTKRRRSQICIAYYDHQTRTAPKPAVLCERDTDDPRGNAALTLDDEGRLWIFISAVADLPAEVYRGVEPYGIDAFVPVGTARFADPQVWFVEGQGFGMFCRFADGPPGLYFVNSPDGLNWSTPQLIARFGRRHDAVSSRSQQNKLGVAFNVLAEGGPWSGGTNLYYLETPDLGKTWFTGQNQAVSLPLLSADNPAMAHDHQATAELIFPLDLNFDPHGRPVALYLASRSDQSGPPGNWRKFFTARPVAAEWEISGLLLADSNYDVGCIYAEGRTDWRLIASTILERESPPVAPQPYMPGGEMLAWTSDNLGRTWTPRWLTSHSSRNQSFARRPANADPDFYVLWCGAHARQRDDVDLYFATRDGAVYHLPREISGDAAAPEPMPRAVTTTVSPE